MDNKGFRAGFLGLIGKPNAGKSTLLNFLIDERLAIVSSKPQSTRRRVHGIVNTKGAQIILVDAPGVVKSEKGLNKFLHEEYKDVMLSSDAIAALIPLDEPRHEQVDIVIKEVADSGKPWMIIITKSDMEQYARRIAAIKLKAVDYNVPVFEVSSTSSSEEVREELAQMLAGLLPVGEGPLYPDLDLFTTDSMRDIVVEIIRDQLFEKLYHELPYSLAVRVSKFEETDPNIARIYAEILVSRISHKAMVIGKNGEILKDIGTAARKRLEHFMGTKVYLNLQVQVREKWTENPRLMKELGYVVEKD